MKTNYHTHTKWCDGAATPREMADAAISAGFETLGFSSHAMLPGDMLEWPVTAAKLPRYAAEIRELAAEYSGRLEILLGVEADYLPGSAAPSRKLYDAALEPAGLSLDFMIGSIHFLRAPDGAIVDVDKSPGSFVEGVKSHFGGDFRAFAEAYFAAERRMVEEFDFDIVGHADLLRKFNGRLNWLDESAPWYLKELEATADAIAASGKTVEINTGGISRGWMADAYPSQRFCDALAARGVPFVYGADAHSANFGDFGEIARISMLARPLRVKRGGAGNARGPVAR